MSMRLSKTLTKILWKT